MKEVHESQDYNAPQVDGTVLFGVAEVRDDFVGPSVSHEAQDASDVPSLHGHHSPCVIVTPQRKTGVSQLNMDLNPVGEGKLRGRKVPDTCLEAERQGRGRRDRRLNATHESADAAVEAHGVGFRLGGV